MTVASLQSFTKPGCCLISLHGWSAMLFLEFALPFPLSSSLPVLSNKLLNLKFLLTKLGKYWEKEAVQKIPCDTLLLPLDQTILVCFLYLDIHIQAYLGEFFSSRWLWSCLSDLQILYVDPTVLNLLHSLPFLTLWCFQNCSWTCLESYIFI